MSIIKLVKSITMAHKHTKTIERELEREHQRLFGDNTNNLPKYNIDEYDVEEQSMEQKEYFSNSHFNEPSSKKRKGSKNELPSKRRKESKTVLSTSAVKPAHSPVLTDFKYTSTETVLSYIKTNSMDNILTFIINSKDKLGLSDLVKGYDVSTNPPTNVSCKIIEPDHISGFMNSEAYVYQTISSKPHPNIPKIIKCLRASDGNERAYVIFPSYNGNLHSLINKRNSSLPKGLSKNFSYQLLKAVEYFHDLRITLRNLCLSKIHFSDAKQQKLVIADLTGSILLPPQVRFVKDKIGLPSYLAPEVITQGIVDPFKTDIWSLGIIIFVLFTGNFPFQAKSRKDLFRQIILQSIIIPDSVPSMVKDILQLMLNRNPLERADVHTILESSYFSNYNVDEY